MGEETATQQSVPESVPVRLVSPQQAQTAVNPVAVDSLEPQPQPSQLGASLEGQNQTQNQPAADTAATLDGTFPTAATQSQSEPDWHQESPFRRLFGTKLATYGILSILLVVGLVTALFIYASGQKPQVASGPSLSLSLNSMTINTASDSLHINLDTVIDRGKTLTATGPVVLQNNVNSTAAFKIQNAAGTSNLFIADTTNNRIGIGKAPTLGVLDVNGSIYQNGHQVCDTSGNCINTGGNGGAISGSGSSGTIALFNGSGSSIGNSNLSQSGSTVTATGNLNINGQLWVGGNQISSANLSNDANLAKLNGNQTFTGINTFTGGVRLQNTSGTNLLSVNSQNNLVALGQANAQTGALVFYGSANGNSITVAGLNGSTSNQSIFLPDASGTICLTTGNCAGLGGNGNILQGGNSFGAALLLGTNDNFGFNLETNGHIVAGLSNTGAATFQNSTNSTTAFQIQNAAGTSNLLVADTTDSKIGIGTNTPTATLTVQDMFSAAPTNANLTVSGNEITDATRTTNTQGDGKTPPDSSYGIWEGTTNLIPNGGFESNTTGWASNNGAHATPSRDTTTSKFGVGSLKVVTDSTTQTGVQVTTNTISASASTIYTASAWVNAPLGQSMQLVFNAYNVNTFINSIITTFTGTGSWQRVTATLTTGVGTNNVDPFIVTNSATATTFWVDGAQIEQKSTATPYVETNGATASRTAARVQAPSSLLNATQGWVAMRVRFGNPSGSQQMNFFGWTNTADNDGIRLFWDHQDGDLFVIHRGTGHLTANADQANLGHTPALGEMVTVIAAWDSGNLYLSINGSSFSSAVASTQIPTTMFSTFDIGGFGNAAIGTPIDSDVLWTATGTGTLSNTDASNLNAFGNTDPTLTGLSGTLSLGDPTMAWAANTASYQTQVGIGNPIAFQVQNATGLNLLSVDASAGQVSANTSALFKNASNSTTAFQIQGVGGSSATLLTADTANSRIGIDNSYSSMGAPGSLSLATATGGSLTASTTYYYKVTAIDSAGGETTPSPENSIATTSGNRTINITWTPVTGASGYRIYRGISSNSETGYYSTLGTVSGSNLTFSDSGATQNNTTATPPGSNSAYISTNNSNNNLQLSVGGNGTPTGQLYVSGTVPNGPLGSMAGFTNGGGLALNGNYLFEADQSGLHVLDVSNPAEPVQVGSSSTGLQNGIEQIQGRYLYAYSTSIHGINIFDISNPTSPYAVSSFSSSASFFVQGKYLYTGTSNGGLTTYDISNPANPVQVGASPHVFSGASQIYASGRYAYALDISAHHQLDIFDITNPNQPAFISSVGVGLNGNDATALYVIGRYAYVTNNSTGNLQIIDVSVPTNPVLVSTLALSGAGPLFVQGRYAYVVVTNGSPSYLETVDVSNPSAPFGVGSTQLANVGRVVYVQGRYAYVTTSNGTNYGLGIYDLGGAYIQQLQSGGIETGSLQVDGSSSIIGNESVSGGVVIGATLQVASSASLGGLTLSGIVTPTAPTVTPHGGSGTNYSYAVAAFNAGGSSPASSATSASAPATLNSSGNNNVITWASVSGAVGYNIYRTASAGTPSSIGFIGTVYASATLSFTDTGIAAVGSVPTTNTSANLTAGGTALFQNASNSTTAFQVQNATGTAILGVDTTAGLVNLGTPGSSGANGQIVFNSATAGNYAVTLGVSSNQAASYTLNLPTAAPVQSQCLMVDSVDATQLTFGTCATGGGGGSGTLQDAYNNSSSPAAIITTSPSKTIALKAGVSNDSTSLFQIQSSSSVPVLDVDTTNARVGIDLNNPTAALSLASGSTAAAGIAFGTDTNLYRSGAGVLKTDNSLTVGTNLVGNGTVLFRNTADSASAVQIQNATGTSNLFKADTLDTRIGIAAAAPAYTLDVGGDINTSAAYRVNGIQISTASLSDASNIGLLNANNIFSGNNTLTGSVLAENTANSTTAFQIQGSTGNILLVADTTNMRVYIGNPAGDSAGSILVLSNKTTAGDPSGANGAMYYNASLGKFRCYENGAWENCIYGAQTVVKSASQTLSSTSYADINDIGFTVGASKSYVLQCSLLVSVGGNGGNISMNGPAGPSSYTATFLKASDQSAGDQFTTSNTYDDPNGSGAFLISTSTTGSNKFILSYQAVLVNGANAGTWQLRAKGVTGGSLTFYPLTTCDMRPF